MGGRHLKKMKYVWKILALLIILTSSLAGCENVSKRANQTDTWNKIEKRGTVVVGLDDSFVPMGFRQKNGQLAGYDIDLAREVFKRLGLKVSFQTIDWSMKETELRNGTIDLIWNGYTKTKAREKTVAFSHTYLKNEQILVSKKKNQILRPADMKNKLIGLQSGSSGYTAYNEYPSMLKQYPKQAIQYDTFTNAFLDLNANRIQGLVIDSVYANYYIAHLKDPASYRTLKVGFPNEDFAIGMRKGDKTLRHKINLTLAQMAQDGSLNKLNQKWFGENNQISFKDVKINKK